jgi:hypothetical protein
MPSEKEQVSSIVQECRQDNPIPQTGRMDGKQIPRTLPGLKNWPTVWEPRSCTASWTG